MKGKGSKRKTKKVISKLSKIRHQTYQGREFYGLGFVYCKTNRR